MALLAINKFVHRRQKQSTIDICLKKAILMTKQKKKLSTLLFIPIEQLILLICTQDFQPAAFSAVNINVKIYYNIHLYTNTGRPST